MVCIEDYVNRIIQGDCLEILKTFPDNSIDSVVTDPPYGLSKEPDIAEVMAHWLNGDDYEHRGGGFMGKSWDSFVPGPSIWREVHRVLKPGGIAFVFGGTRTYDLMTVALRFAGFRIADSIQWLHGQGFPKAYDIAKGIEGKITRGSANWNEWKHLNGKKRNGHLGYTKIQADQGYRPSDYTGNGRAFDLEPTTNEAEVWQGWKSPALKPAHEPIIVAEKPIDETYANNALTWGVAGLWIDGARIETRDDLARPFGHIGNNGGYANQFRNIPRGTVTGDTTKGRWPANVILSHHPECKQVGMKQIKSQSGGDSGINHNTAIWGNTKETMQDGRSYADSDGYETVEAWDCHSDCSVRLLDEQSGVRPSSYRKNRNSHKLVQSGMFSGRNGDTPYTDSGGTSRYFKVLQIDANDFSTYNTQNNSSERGILCGQENTKDVDTFAGKRTASKGDNSKAGGCGSNITGRFLTDTISITKTETLSIMTFPILSVSSDMLIGICTIESESSISLLTASSIDSVNVATSGKVLITTRNESWELIKATVKIVSVNTLRSGELKTESATMPICESTEKSKEINRFFYCAKSSKRERGDYNDHPCVKPLSLLEYLARLSKTPTGGIVLDPFSGSGTTALAAIKTGRQYICIEQDPHYVEIAERRVSELEGVQLELVAND